MLNVYDGNLIINDNTTGKINKLFNTKIMCFKQNWLNKVYVFCDNIVPSEVK